MYFPEFPNTWRIFLFLCAMKDLSASTLAAKPPRKPFLAASCQGYRFSLAL
jgi:hypothetical protein